MRRPPTSLAGILKINIARPCASQKDIPFWQPLIFRGFVGFRKCNDSTEFKTYSSKWVHMFHPQRSFEQKIRPPKKTTETCCLTSPINLPHPRPPHLGGNRFLTFNNCRFDGCNDCWLEVANLQTFKVLKLRMCWIVTWRELRSSLPMRKGI